MRVGEVWAVSAKRHLTSRHTCRSTSRRKKSHFPSRLEASKKRWEPELRCPADTCLAMAVFIAIPIIRKPVLDAASVSVSLSLSVKNGPCKQIEVRRVSTHASTSYPGVKLTRCFWTAPIIHHGHDLGFDIDLRKKGASSTGPSHPRVPSIDPSIPSLSPSPGDDPGSHPSSAPMSRLSALGSPRLGPRRALVVSRNLICFVPDARQKQALAVLSHCSGIPSRHSRLRGRVSRCVASHRTPNPNDRAWGRDTHT